MRQDFEEPETRIKSQRIANRHSIFVLDPRLLVLNLLFSCLLIPYSFPLSFKRLKPQISFVRVGNTAVLEGIITPLALCLLLPFGALAQNKGCCTPAWRDALQSANSIRQPWSIEALTGRRWVKAANIPLSIMMRSRSMDARTQKDELRYSPIKG